MTNKPRFSYEIIEARRSTWVQLISQEVRTRVPPLTRVSRLRAVISPAARRVSPQIWAYNEALERARSLIALSPSSTSTTTMLKAHWPKCYRRRRRGALANPIKLREKVFSKESQEFRVGLYWRPSFFFFSIPMRSYLHFTLFYWTNPHRKSDCGCRAAGYNFSWSFCEGGRLGLSSNLQAEVLCSVSDKMHTYLTMILGPQYFREWL